jgi:hypothetical protein
MNGSEKKLKIRKQILKLLVANREEPSLRVRRRQSSIPNRKPNFFVRLPRSKLTENALTGIQPRLMTRER